MQLTKSLTGDWMLQAWPFGYCTRVFLRPLPHWGPFAFDKWGVIHFGIGPIGVNIFKRRRNGN